MRATHGCLATRLLAIAGALLMALLTTAVASPPASADSRGPVRIRTIPAVAGFPVTVDDQTVVTDAFGIARFASLDNNDLSRRIKLRDAYLEVGGARAHVVGARFFPTGEPRLSLDIFWQVSPRYSNVNGGRLDVAKIDSLTLKSSTGEVLRLPPREPVWLQGLRVVPLSGGLEAKKLFWTVQEVTYTGSNVVNASQQRFQPADTQAVDIQLLFYTATFTVRDAVFGFGTGSTVELTYPDKAVERLELGDSHEVVAPSLPRGNYSVVVDGPGPGMSRPTAISRNQAVDLKFYSWLDIVVVLVAIEAFVGGTLALGLRRRVRHRMLVVPVEATAPREDPAPHAQPLPSERLG